MKTTKTSVVNSTSVPRVAFVVALLMTLGAAVATLQTSLPVREAYGLQPIIEGLPAGAAKADSAWFLSTSTSVRLESTTVRALGNGTRRAFLLESTEIPASGLATRQPVVIAPVATVAANVVEPSNALSE